jgi:hypothetical protein
LTSYCRQYFFYCEHFFGSKKKRSKVCLISDCNVSYPLIKRAAVTLQACSLVNASKVNTTEYLRTTETSHGCEETYQPTCVVRVRLLSEQVNVAC